MSASSVAIEEDLKLRCKKLEIERSCADWRCEQYQKLLEEVTGGHGFVPAREGEEGEQIIATSSRSFPDDQDQRRRQRARRRTSTPPVTGPLEIVQDRNQENRERFIGIVAALCADNSPGNRSVIFGAAGLGDYQLAAPQEVTCATQTPEIGWKTFGNIFGGQMYAERPKARKVPGYHTGNLLCLTYITQPLAPTRIGEPGVILSPPDAALSGDTFHVFVDPTLGEKKKELRYCGLYSKAHRPMGVQIDEWHSLSEQCRRKWLFTMGPERSKVREFHARCALRKREGFLSDPSQSEVRKWTRKYYQGDEVMEPKAIQDALDSGAEEFSFETIFCVGYDTGLAAILKREMELRAQYVH